MANLKSNSLALSDKREDVDSKNYYDLEKIERRVEVIHHIEDSNSVSIQSQEINEENSSHIIPNGGYGWVIAFVGFLINFVMFGTCSIWGVFSNAYATSILNNKTTTMELMGVGSLALICINLFAPIGSILASYGIRVAMVVGGTIISSALILASFSTEVWHLYLTQALLFGTGGSLVYMTTVNAISQWFTTRRATAMGLSASGTGLGGLVLSPLTNFLITKYGLPWTYRIIGLIAFSISMIAACLIRSNLPPEKVKQPIRSPIKFSLFKNIDFVIALYGLVISSAGYTIPLFYIPKYCTTYNISSADSSVIVGVALATNAVGRLVIGYIADRVGRINMYIIASTATGLFCTLIWPFAKTFGSIMLFAALFGFTGGVYYILAAPITTMVVGVENVSYGLSILFIASSIGGIGAPVASAIQQITPEQSYIGVQIFSGALYILGALICLILKLKINKSFFSFA
ncbi:major facilitator superfamily domain-containing protein [Gilbertella persicaria]|uniref:major facilitator superfamily domain-containing protein n=1 Tax=Gilbertella persicaria TaxID=101096 RepID=UPI00221EC826|nr:major facilitator superfamily domain-containing protein [Gilbertella persicaria]KAI8091012.1 major facilitator superfamily domain-containing protein [Gilbertella persicaria]